MTAARSRHRIFPPQPGDVMVCLGQAGQAPWYESVDLEGHWASEEDKNVTSSIHRRAAHPGKLKNIPVSGTFGSPRRRFSAGSIVRVTYAEGTTAEARVYTDGTYYGQADVECGRATVEVAYEVPEDTYHTWVVTTPAETLERIESMFHFLVEVNNGDLDVVGGMMETLATYEIHTHFRRWAGKL